MAENLIQVHIDLLYYLNHPTPIVATAGSLVLTISVLTSIWSAGNVLDDLIRNPPPIQSLFGTVEVETVDFIIVGGGSAGLVAANRLSENGKFKVMVLEAGGDPSILNAIPELAPYNIHHPSTDWEYRIVSQPNVCRAIYKHELAWPRAKMLGGCSSMNWMIYQRGHPKDYEQWVEATGDSKWSYDELLPFFKKSENYHGWFPDPKYHGSEGPLDVSKQSYVPCLKEWIEAGKELGYDTTTDPNSRQVPGFYPMDVTIYQGFRESTDRAFLKPILNRENLKVSKYSHVIKVNIDRSIMQANGVTYVKDGKTYTVKARKEVILSAGTIGTPHLLMLSGVGPSSHLVSVGVDPIKDLPGVGQNLQDHVLTLFGPFLLNATISFLLDRDMDVTSMMEYVKNRTGPFSFNELSGIGFIATTQSTDPDWPDIEFHHSPLGLRKTIAGDLTALFGTKPSIFKEFLHPFIGQDSNFVLVDLGRPKSSGEIKLRNSDPFTHPLIDPKYYSDPSGSDMAAMVEALQFVIGFYENTKTWQKYGARLIPRILPGCEGYVWKSVDYLECYIRQLTFTIYHPCGTSKMGKVDDLMAVVDPNLRVRGIKRLRVADASVFPVITNANLNAPSILMGEKVADFLLTEWNGITTT